MPEESSSSSESCSSSSFADWEPITVEILVSSVSMLRDQAMAAWGAAGDTVIIDGATVAEGTAGRGIFRIFGLAGLLLSMDGGGPMGTRIHENITWQYTWPDNRQTSGSLTGHQSSGNYGLAPITTTISPSVSLDVGTGVCSLVDPVTLSVGVCGLDEGMSNFGRVTFYIGEYVRTVDVCGWQNQGESMQFGIAIVITGEDIGGPPTGSYNVVAVYNGVVSGTTAYTSATSNTCIIGVN